ncbi:hypothetical protein BJ878DRAFT_242856 [Calycina marina]|uniref:Uncharacterized protein n=1 Tax=Calycina marina TaxID=1763456 RepID=A0A9P8CBR5_9HELO|nr:hypothetical protein BJ878DRAFT_242856 [Calycina marina]
MKSSLRSSLPASPIIVPPSSLVREQSSSSPSSSSGSSSSSSSSPKSASPSVLPRTVTISAPEIPKQHSSANECAIPVPAPTSSRSAPKATINGFPAAKPPSAPSPSPAPSSSTTDWETSTGTLASVPSSDSLHRIENIAFARSYILSKPGGITLGSTSFQIIRLAAGKSHRLMRSSGESICCVARGRTGVVLQKESTFSIGEGGMWRVRGGEGCVVRNAGEEGDVVVHVVGV